MSIAGRLVPLIAVLALTGCVAQLPPAPTVDEVLALQAEESRQWWESMYPGEPMPAVAVVEYTAPALRDGLASACVEDWLGFPIGDNVTPEQFEQVNLAYWTCYARYPIDPASDRRLSSDQLAYAYAYFAKRSVPCLERLGFEMPPEAWSSLTLGGAEATGHPSWNPYWQVLTDFTQPRDDNSFVLEACPPPPFDYPWMGF